MQNLTFVPIQISYFDLKGIIKTQFTQKQMANKLHISTRQLQNLLNNPDQITIERLNQILSILNYKLELRIDKI